MAVALANRVTYIEGQLQGIFGHLNAVQDATQLLRVRVSAFEAKRWYQDTSKLFIIMSLAALAFAVWGNVTSWKSDSIAEKALALQVDAYNLSKVALELQIGANSIADQQAALQEWSLYKTYPDYCNTTVVSPHPLIPHLSDFVTGYSWEGQILSATRAKQYFDHTTRQ